MKVVESETPGQDGGMRKLECTVTKVSRSRAEPGEQPPLTIVGQVGGRRLVYTLRPKNSTLTAVTEDGRGKSVRDDAERLAVFHGLKVFAVGGGKVTVQQQEKPGDELLELRLRRGEPGTVESLEAAPEAAQLPYYWRTGQVDETKAVAAAPAPQPAAERREAPAARDAQPAARQAQDAPSRAQPARAPQPTAAPKPEAAESKRPAAPAKASAPDVLAPLPELSTTPKGTPVFARADGRMLLTYTQFMNLGHDIAMGADLSQLTTRVGELANLSDEGRLDFLGLRKENAKAFTGMLEKFAGGFYMDANAALDDYRGLQTFFFENAGKLAFPHLDTPVHEAIIAWVKQGGSGG